MEFRKEDAEFIREELKKRGIIEFEYSINKITGKEHCRFLYNNKEEKEKHIEIMKEKGWRYSPDCSQTNQILYDDLMKRLFNNKEDSIIVLCADFFKREQSILFENE